MTLGQKKAKTIEQLLDELGVRKFAFVLVSDDVMMMYVVSNAHHSSSTNAY